MGKHLGKILLTILSVLTFFSVIYGCSKKENKIVASSNHTWYLYQDQGENDVTSIKFSNKVAKVKDISSIGDKVGIDRLNVHSKEPSYALGRDGKSISINSSKPVNFILKKKYKDNVYGRHMQGYYVKYNGTTYKFAYITSVDKNKSDAIRQTGSQKISRTQIANHIVNINYDATPLKNQTWAGNYDFKTIINYRRTDGNLAISKNGTFQMTLTEHSAQPLNDTTDSTTVMDTLVISGQVNNLYGKYYLVPKNLLTINYYYHGQNTARLLPRSVNLKVDSKSTGNQIDMARMRIEQDGDQLYLFSDDLTTRQQENQTNAKGNLLSGSNTDQVSLKNAISQTYRHYENYKGNPIQSNADLMQLAGAISDNNDKKLGTVPVDFGGKYNTDQTPTDFKGVDVDGNAQPNMQYVFFVTAAQNGENSPTVATTKGKYLIYGSLNKQLYLLRQPDKDSTTVTWTLVKNVSLEVPTLKFSLN